jgi:hypothetical protein
MKSVSIEQVPNGETWFLMGRLKGKQTLRLSRVEDICGKQYRRCLDCNKDGTEEKDGAISTRLSTLKDGCKKGR